MFVYLFIISENIEKNRAFDKKRHDFTRHIIFITLFSRLATWRQSFSFWLIAIAFELDLELVLFYHQLEIQISARTNVCKN